MPLPLLLEVVSSLPSSSGTMVSNTCWMAVRGKMHFGDGLDGRFDKMDFMLDRLMRIMLLLRITTPVQQLLAVAAAAAAANHSVEEFGGGRRRRRIEAKGANGKYCVIPHHFV